MMAERAGASGAVNDGGQAARVQAGRDAAPDKGGFDRAMAKARAGSNDDRASRSSSRDQARGGAEQAASQREPGRKAPDKAGLALGSTLAIPTGEAASWQGTMAALGRLGAMALRLGSGIGAATIVMTPTSTAPREMDERPENFQNLPIDQNLPIEKSKEPSEADRNREKQRAKGLPDSAIGNSGKPKTHEVKHPNKKEAEEAAAQAGEGKPMHHPSPTRGRPHFHPTDSAGNKQMPNVHHSYPKKR